MTIIQYEWIEWGGGPCPTAVSAKVAVKLRSREAAGAPPMTLWAKDLNWRFNADPGDIVAYKVVKEGEGG